MNNVKSSSIFFPALNVFFFSTVRQKKNPVFFTEENGGKVTECNTGTLIVNGIFRVVETSRNGKCVDVSAIYLLSI